MRKREGEEGGRRKDRKGRVRQRRTSALRQISAGARSLIGSKKHSASAPFLDSEASGELRNQGWQLQASYAAWGWFMKVHAFRIWKSFSLAVMIDTRRLESADRVGYAFCRALEGYEGQKQDIEASDITDGHIFPFLPYAWNLDKAEERVGGVRNAVPYPYLEWS